MTPLLRVTVAEYNAVAEDAQSMAFLARAQELQQVAIEKIDRFLKTLVNRKEEAIAAADESAANTLLAMELALQAVRAEIAMCLKLKSDEPEEAWNDLVTAQYRLKAASAVRRQIASDTTGLDNGLSRLLFIERWLFPPQMFSSFGGKVKSRECSICGDEYDNCDHIRGRAYMGRLCSTIVHEVDLEEVSVVTDPADKRCRVTHFSDQGKMRNKMTWRLEECRPDVAPDGDLEQGFDNCQGSRNR